jgi:hypothetical protein
MVYCPPYGIRDPKRSGDDRTIEKTSAENGGGLFFALWAAVSAYTPATEVG